MSLATATLALEARSVPRRDKQGFRKPEVGQSKAKREKDCWTRRGGQRTGVVSGTRVVSNPCLFFCRRNERKGRNE